MHVIVWVLGTELWSFERVTGVLNCYLLLALKQTFTLSQTFLELILQPALALDLWKSFCFSLPELQLIIYDEPLHGRCVRFMKVEIFKDKFQAILSDSLQGMPCQEQQVLCETSVLVYDFLPKSLGLQVSHVIWGGGLNNGTDSQELLQELAVNILSQRLSLGIEEWRQKTKIIPNSSIIVKFSYFKL